VGISSSPVKYDFLSPRMRALAPYLILALAIFAVYFNIYDNAFVFDDDTLIATNDYLRGWGHIGDILTGATTDGAHLSHGNYRPLQILLYLLLFNLGGGSVFLFHLLNTSLHAANTCLVYRLGTKLNFMPWPTFLAALTWGVHPIHTEAITYMSGTADLLFAFFCLLALVILLPSFTSRNIFNVIPLFLLGLLSKETAVMFPLLVMACLYLTHPQRFRVRTYMRTWPLWVITIVYFIWRLNDSSFSGPQSFAHDYTSPPLADKLYIENLAYRIYTFMATLPAYLSLIVNPVDLHFERVFPVYADL